MQGLWFTELNHRTKMIKGIYREVKPNCDAETKKGEVDEYSRKPIMFLINRDLTQISGLIAHLKQPGEKWMQLVRDTSQT